MLDNYELINFNNNIFIFIKKSNKNIELISIDRNDIIIASINILEYSKKIKEDEYQNYLKKIDLLLLDFMNIKNYLKEKNNNDFYQYRNDIFLKVYKNYYISSKLELIKIDSKEKIIKKSNKKINIRDTILNDIEIYCNILEKVYNKHNHE